MTLDEDTLERILDKVLNKKRSISEETHTTHHAYVQYLIERREMRIEMWKKFETSLIGGIAISLLGFLAWVGKLIIDHIHLK